MIVGLLWPESIEEYVLSAFRSVSIHTPVDLLGHDECTLSKLTGLSRTTCASALKAIISMFAVTSENASELIANRVLLPLGIGEMDSILEGGINLEWLVEIYGEAGSGKTQFCLSLASNTLHRGRAVFWIDTEGSFRPYRLSAILEGNANSLDKLSVARCSTVAEFRNCIESVAVYCDNADVPPLLIIDSIGAIMKASGVTKNELCYIAETLKSLKCFVVCSNHVVANFAAAKGTDTYKPALGSTWAHLVTCCFLIERRPDENNTRIIRVLKSPTCGPSELVLRMSVAGLQ